MAPRPARVERLAPRLRLHHHAGATAVRACRPRCGAGRGSSPAGRAHGRRSGRSAAPCPGARIERRKVLGEDRDDVDPHGLGLLAEQAGPVVEDDPPPATSTSGTSAVTNGNSTSPWGVPMTRRSWAALCSTRVSSPTTVPSTVSTPEPDQLVVVELLGVLRVLVRFDGHDELGAASGLGRGPVGDLLEAHEQPALVRPGAGNRQRRCPALGAQDGPSANRRAGSSVRGSTATSPRRPVHARSARPRRSRTHHSSGPAVAGFPVRNGAHLGSVGDRW